MNKLDFEQLADYILLCHKDFTKGFANAFKDDINNAIWVRYGFDPKCLLPSDVYAGYFYLRNDSAFKYEPKQDERITDSGTQRLTFLDSITVNLVALIDNADEFDLIEKLRDICMSYEEMNVIPSSANWSREQIIADELKGMQRDDVSAVLQRLRNHTVVRLVLNVSKPFVANNCSTISQN